MNWIPTLLWEEYQIDYYSINVVVKNHMCGGLLIFTSMTVEEPEYHYTFVDFSCAQYNFSVAAVNEIHGESDYVNITGSIGSGNYSKYYRKLHEFT